MYQEPFAIFCPSRDSNSAVVVVLVRTAHLWGMIPSSACGHASWPQSESGVSQPPRDSWSRPMRDGWHLRTLDCGKPDSENTKRIYWIQLFTVMCANDQFRLPFPQNFWSKNKIRNVILLSRFLRMVWNSLIVFCQTNLHATVNKMQG